MSAPSHARDSAHFAHALALSKVCEADKARYNCSTLLRLFKSEPEAANGFGWKLSPLNNAPCVGFRTPTPSASGTTDDIEFQRRTTLSGQFSQRWDTGHQSVYWGVQRLMPCWGNPASLSFFAKFKLHPCLKRKQIGKQPCSDDEDCSYDVEVKIIAAGDILPSIKLRPTAVLNVAKRNAIMTAGDGWTL